MTWSNGAGIVLLGILLGAQYVSREVLKRLIRFAWGAAFVLFLGISTYSAWRQYAVWRAGPATQFLLPPYQPIAYFISYVGTRVFAPWLLALLASILLSRLLAALNKRYGERFFESEETPLFGAAVFFVGYPGFLFYIPLMLLAGVALSLFYTARGLGRTPLYYLWIPVAIFAILLIRFVVPVGILNGFIL